MSLILKDRVWESSTSTGTGAFSLAGTKAGYRTFGSVMANGDTCFYTIVADNGLWETGLGTYNSGANTLTRTARYDNSSGDTSTINFSAGAKEVFLSLPASRFVEKLSSTTNLQDLTDASAARSNLGLGAAAVAGVYAGGSAPSNSDVMSASPSNIELTYNGSGNRTSFIDFHSRDGTDYDARIIKGAANSSLQIIATNGSVTNTISLSPVAQLVDFNLESNAGVQIYRYAPGGGGTTGLVRVHANGTPGGTAYADFLYNGAVVGSIAVASSSSISFNTTSDYRLKTNVKPIENALERIEQTKPIEYTWKSDESWCEGFIAHEIQEIIPYAVIGEKDAVDEEGNIKHQSMDYSKITPLLCAGIKELIEEVRNLKLRIQELENNG